MLPSWYPKWDIPLAQLTGLGMYTMRNTLRIGLAVCDATSVFVVIMKHCIIFTEVVSFAYKAWMYGLLGLEVKRLVAYTGLRVITHLGPGQVISVDYQTGMCLVRLDMTRSRSGSSPQPCSPVQASPADNWPPSPWPVWRVGNRRPCSLLMEFLAP